MYLSVTSIERLKANKREVVSPREGVFHNYNYIIHVKEVNNDVVGNARP
jgi:hypothetical protein